MRHVDVLVVLPLTAADEIFVSADEDLPLRAAMNDILLDLVADGDITGGRPTVVEITGDRDRRLAALEAVGRTSSTDAERSALIRRADSAAP